MKAGCSVRCLMLYVAALALCMAASDYLAVSNFFKAECRALAAHHAYEAKLVDQKLRSGQSPQFQHWMVQRRRYHKRLENEYREAASRPFWQGLGPPPDEAGMPGRAAEKVRERTLP